MRYTGSEQHSLVLNYLSHVIKVASKLAEITFKTSDTLIDTIDANLYTGSRQGSPTHTVYGFYGNLSLSKIKLTHLDIISTYSTVTQTGS